MKAKRVPPRIAELRKSLGWTQVQFGQRIGMTQGQISNLETGTNVPAGIRTALVIAGALGATVEAVWPALTLPAHVQARRRKR
jgi:transcriptional regulator with XRE-family HTH domain